MRVKLIVATLIASLPVAATAQRSATRTTTAHVYSTAAPKSVQTVSPSLDETVCLRDADTRQVICHTRAQWKMIYVERAARKNFDAK